MRNYALDHVNHVQYETGRYTVSAVDIEIECSGLIRANGWTVLAKIEHGANGNIVTPFGGAKSDPEWFHIVPHCDHCGTNRTRRETYMVRNESGDLRQVGKSCLKDYTGINPSVSALWAAVRGIVEDDSYIRGEPSRTDILYPAVTVIAHACDSVRERGYRKSDEPGSAKEDVMRRIGEAPSDTSTKEAEDIASWISGMDGGSDFEQNAQSLVRGRYVRIGQIGRLFYLPVSYKRHLERVEMERERERENEKLLKSVYVGEIGQRVTLVADKAELLTSWDTQWGTTRLYRFVDGSGNVFVWFSSSGIDADKLSAGLTLKGTVKDHGERDGVKQTVLTRCKIVA